MTQVRHDPGECKDALARTCSPVVVDLETTGVRRSSQIVSAGILVDEIAYILFLRSSHPSIRNLSREIFLDALQPLARTDLVVIGHNLPFDLRFLKREGVQVGGEARDTLKLLRLIDQDRGREGGTQDKHQPRMDLAAPDGGEIMNYKLKAVAAQLLGIRMPSFPGQIELAPYDRHARYLACDLVGTKKLHDFLWGKLTDVEKKYYQEMVAPLIPLLLDMNAAGVAVDTTFVQAEGARLQALLAKISKQHEEEFRVALGMNREDLNRWLFKRLALPVLKKQRQGKTWAPSLNTEAMRRLRKYTDNSRVIRSLDLIQQYRNAAELLKRLRPLSGYVDRATGRIHSKFDDRQATGRVSSSKPNLQQLAKVKTIAKEEFRTRNTLVATAGYELAVFDIGQADIRVLAHAVESFRDTTEDHQKILRAERMERLSREARTYYSQRGSRRNPNFIGQRVESPMFSPDMPADLAADFRDAKGDFYSTAVKRILGRAPKDKAERDRFKGIILSVVNGQGPPSLAKALDVSEDEAKVFLEDFAKAYPKVDGYKRLMHWQIAYTGQTATFLGRPRTVTAHRWLVDEPKVRILVSHKGAPPCWVEIVPLEPNLRVLTSYVLRAWNAKTNKLIYDHERGPLSNQPYPIFDRSGQYLLPYRNWAWRSIRRVRAQNQEASYEGFDATARAAFNFICQGGTADICKRMMLRAQPVCRKFEARLLIQIHDELVFEVPKASTALFLQEMKRELEKPPVTDFKVPIVVEPKRGFAFGQLTEVKP